MIHRVKIEKIITGGFGLARLHDGFVVLTRYVLPGETVLVRETARHRGYLEALPEEILDASPDRISPPCQWFTSCGGCDFQHIKVSCQHRIKTEIVRESLARAKVSADDSVFSPLLRSPLSYRYRFRIRLKVGPEGEIGYYRTGSNDLVHISRCLLATDSINQALSELQASDILKRTAPDIEEIELLHSPADNRILALMHLHRKVKSLKSLYTSFTVTFHTINEFLIKKGKKIHSLTSGKSTAMLTQDFNGCAGGPDFSLSWGSGCFYQVNAPQNQNLVDLASRLYRQTEGRKVLDLFCGMGNFSIPLALCGASISGIEQNPESIRWAERNAQKNGLLQYRFLADDVGRYLHSLANQADRYDFVLLDPPRQGLGRQTYTLAALGAKNILYISCDPATMARDLAVLTGNGYRLCSLTPVDMFPQTHHIETVTLLEKN